MIVLPTAALGAPWCRGGESPNTGFDCWGVVRYVYIIAGKQPPTIAEVSETSWGEACGGKTLEREWATGDWALISYPVEPLRDLDVVINYADEDIHASVVIDADKRRVATALKATGLRTFRIDQLNRVEGVYRRKQLT